MEELKSVVQTFGRKVVSDKRSELIREAAEIRFRNENMMGGSDDGKAGAGASVSKGAEVGERSHEDGNIKGAVGGEAEGVRSKDETGSRTVEKGDNKVESSDLSELIKLLTLKIRLEEKNEGRTNISVEGFGKIIPDYDGISIPVSQWLDNFEKNADAYGLNEKQKYVQARNKMTKTAQLFWKRQQLATMSP